ncbi:unnamed protein product [Citrullus colocynthis]|uniref:Uncharacterized protein n=1 Tax=Citrullus colocynthis TaxID=252529 RepID=A0ABP0Z986_9ROSI
MDLESDEIGSGVVGVLCLGRRKNEKHRKKWAVFLKKARATNNNVCSVLCASPKFLLLPSLVSWLFFNGTFMLLM